jgi:gas vesicle protein
MTEHDHDHQRMCGALLAGMGVGATLAGIAAVLLAPRAGTEMRASLKESANKVKDRAESLTGVIREKARAMVEDKTSAFAHAIDVGKQAYAEKRAELESQVKAGE